MKEPLSQAAQAILKATGTQGTPMEIVGRGISAVSIRTAVEQGKLGPEHWEGSFPNEYEKGWNAALDYIMKIATELENIQ